MSDLLDQTHVFQNEEDLIKAYYYVQINIAQGVIVLFLLKFQMIK